MGTADGRIIGTTKIVDHGSPAERFNLVIVAEGYQDTVADMAQFANDAQQFVNRLFAAPPFNGLQGAFNVYRVDVVSTDSGADDPTTCGGTGATPATYFDGSFCNGGIRRLLQVNIDTVLSVVNAQVPEWHQILVIVNSTDWGGSGGSIAVTSRALGWENVAIHEIGHAAFGLADEYEYWAGCGVDTDRDNHPSVEPSEPNVTIDSNRATIKWHDLIASTTPMPTTTNANCTQCDSQPNPVPVGTIGAFEGAHYFHCGAFRPEFNCMMRDLGTFCAACRQRIRETLTPYLTDCEQLYSKAECHEDKSRSYWGCAQYEDQGYNRCDNWEDHGYEQCDSWSRKCAKWLPWPFSYICKVLEWVCKAWVWISNWVCVAWTWISYVVCVAWAWISYVICVAVIWIGRNWCRLSKRRK